MAQTAAGAEKIAAKKMGLAVEEYRQRRAAGLKCCTKCKEWRPLAEFARDATRHDGLKAGCRSCDYAPTRPGPTMRERKSRLAQGELWCSGCLQWFPAAEVVKGTCRPCLNAKRRNRYANDEAHRRQTRAYIHARKRQIDPVPPDGATALMEQFDGLCAYCGAEATTWDHIMPVVNGGKTEPWNIVPACASCNSSKGSRDVREWLDATGRTPHERLVDRLLLEYCGLSG